MQKFTNTIPLSLYIHLPWCVRKCPYCDFNSHKAPAVIPEQEYINALIRDLEENLPSIWGRRLTSIFFGGGTPSLFSATGIERILREVNNRLPFHADMEITLEANPGTIDESRFAGFRTAGINRISLGLQSLQDDKLKALGRIHNSDCAVRAIAATLTAGFNNFNIDLMHGLPQQTVEDALSDLETALKYKPTHLSWYQLTIEPNTLYYHQPPQLPHEEMLWQIQVQGKDLLAKHDYHQYEVSAYARGNRYCVHNMNYWEFGDYLGIGAGAHSKITNMETQQIIRHSQSKNPRDYLNPNKKFTYETRILQQEKDIIFEFMLNALRLTQGFSTQLFSERTGLPQTVLTEKIALAQQKNLLLRENDKYYASELGQRFLNDLVSLFLN
jgi:putative oxygen-independent coproporphyrinogen III oxidase